MTNRRIELYTIYERVWHWVQAAAILSMMLTGFLVHDPYLLGMGWFAVVVRVHNILGFIVVGNAFLGLFYYMATGTIRQYLPEPQGFLGTAVRQAKYYLFGIFHGAPHPLQKSAERRLNPLQQVTYLIILNILLPLQVLSGVLMWSGQRWPEAVSALGGLPGLAFMHGLGAWLFAAFVITHIYLTTTGHTPLSHIKAMIVGYEEIPEHVEQ